MPTIFLSHSHHDDELASALTRWLVEKGFDDVFVDHSSIRSGDKWTEALRRAKGSCRVVMCLVTPAWLDSTECFGEFAAAWYAGRRIIPLISIGDGPLNDHQRQHLARITLEDQGVDFTKAGAPEALDLDAHPEIATPLIAGLRAAGAIAKVGLDPGVFTIDDKRDQEGALVKPPFPGLESFSDTDADAAIFYGRSSEIAQVMEDLREYRANGDKRAYASNGRAYVIQGASGSGKSSLLKAGVLPRLRRERGWLALRSFRPGPDPLLSFAEALVKPLESRQNGTSPGVVRDRLLGHWRKAKADTARVATGTPTRALTAEARAAAARAADLKLHQALRPELDAEIIPLKLSIDRPSASTLISVDQGEELVRAEGESGSALADYLKASLLPGSEDQPADYVVVLTVRTDSFPELQNSPRFEGLATQLFDLRPLPVYRFDSAIEQPAMRYGVEIEPQLVELLMEDAGGRDALPLLAFTLQRLWRQYETEKRIQAVNYESVGKLLGLIEDAAERALRGIDPSAQQTPLSGKVSGAKDSLAQRVFVPTLAQINERGGMTRRVAQLASFDDDRREIVRSFERWRLVVTSGENVEVAHEALFRAWPRFIRWLEPEKARLETLRGLESAAVSWDTHDRRADFISHAGRRLRDATALANIPEFKGLIGRQLHVGAYLSEARRQAFGGKIAGWYTVVVIGLWAAMFIAWAVLAYVFGNVQSLGLGAVMLLTSGLVSVPLAASLTYLAAILRRIVMRWGWYSDAIVLTIVGLVLLFQVGSSLLSWDYSSLDRYFEAEGKTMREQWDRQGAEAVKGISDLTMGIVFSIFLIPFAFVVPPLVWAVLQLLWTLTLPVSWLTRRIGQHLRSRGRAALTNRTETQPAGS